MLNKSAKIELHKKVLRFRRKKDALKKGIKNCTFIYNRLYFLELQNFVV